MWRGEQCICYRRAYTDAIHLDAASPLLYTKRAAAYISLRQASLALRDFNTALELDDSNVNGYIHRGKLRRQTCDVAGAEADFNRVLRLRPGQATATAELAATARVAKGLAQLERAKTQQQQHADGTRRVIDALLADAPDCAEAALAEARMQMGQRDYDNVVGTTGRLLKSRPGDLEALLLRGRAYYFLGEHDLAKRHFGEALKYDPDHEASRQVRRRALRDM